MVEDGVEGVEDGVWEDEEAVFGLLGEGGDGAVEGREEGWFGEGGGVGAGEDVELFGVGGCFAEGHGADGDFEGGGRVEGVFHLCGVRGWVRGEGIGLVNIYMIEFNKMI